MKQVIDDTQIYNYQTVTSKVLIDKESPFLRSVILNRGFNSGLKKGMPILQGPYFAGRITEVNYLSSRVLLISDLNSKIPVLIEPNGYNAIMSGTNEDFAILDFLPKFLQFCTFQMNIFTYKMFGLIRTCTHLFLQT